VSFTTRAPLVGLHLIVRTLNVFNHCVGYPGSLCRNCPLSRKAAYHEQRRLSMCWTRRLRTQITYLSYLNCFASNVSQHQIIRKSCNFVSRLMSSKCLYMLYYRRACVPLLVSFPSTTNLSLRMFAHSSAICLSRKCKVDLGIARHHRVCLFKKMKTLLASMAQRKSPPLTVFLPN
jgi:hypothetical protein